MMIKCPTIRPFPRMNKQNKIFYDDQREGAQKSPLDIGRDHPHCFRSGWVVKLSIEVHRYLTLEKYNVKWIIFPADSFLSKFLLEIDEWNLIYSDKVTDIYVKRIPENQYLIDKYAGVKPVVLEDEEKERKVGQTHHKGQQKH
jgi:hypothetical protein